MARLLMLTHRLPYPPDKGERVRAYHMLRALSPHFQIVLAALAETGRNHAAATRALAEYCRGIIIAPLNRTASLLRGGCRLLSGGCATEAWFSNRRLERLVMDEARREPFDIVLAYSSGMLPLALKVPAIRRVADLVDVDSAKWRSYAADCGPLAALIYRLEAAGVARLEARSVNRCDATVLISQAEADTLAASLHIDDQNAFARLHAVSNGVDAEYFRRDAPLQPWASSHVQPAADDAGSIVFTGTMNYRPNVDGMVWFVRYVWPALRRLRPSCRLTIVGRDPSAAIHRLAETGGIRVTGGVHDVRPYLAEAQLAIAPLHIARGVQNKVLEAMAMGCPVVATPAALEGLEVEPDRHVIQAAAESPGQWVRSIDAILSDGRRLAEIGCNARRHVCHRYLWPDCMSPLVELCRGLMAQRPAGKSDLAAAAAPDPATVVAETATINQARAQ